MSIRNSKYGRALEVAAWEMYGHEIADTLMVSTCIGPGKEWESEDAWVEDRIHIWLCESDSKNDL